MAAKDEDGAGDVLDRPELSGTLHTATSIASIARYEQCVGHPLSECFPE